MNFSFLSTSNIGEEEEKELAFSCWIDKVKRGKLINERCRNLVKVKGLLTRCAREFQVLERW